VDQRDYVLDGVEILSLEGTLLRGVGCEHSMPCMMDLSSLAIIYNRTRPCSRGTDQHPLQMSACATARDGRTWRVGPLYMCSSDPDDCRVSDVSCCQITIGTCYLPRSRGDNIRLVASVCVSVHLSVGALLFEPFDLDFWHEGRP